MPIYRTAMRAFLCVLATAVLIFAVADWATSEVISVQCESNKAYNNLDTNQKNCIALRSRVFNESQPAVVVMLSWLNEGSVLITAFATVVIAAFTVVLANASKRQERWVRLSAEVAAAVERSYVSIDDWALSLPVVGEPPRAITRIYNSGRIPAQLTEVIGKYSVGINVPANPDYTNPLRGVECIVRPGHFITQPFRSTVGLTQDQNDKIRSREFCIFIWGYVRYTDFFGGSHVTGFGVKAVYQDKGDWVYEINGGSAYNYVAQPTTSHGESSLNPN